MEQTISTIVANLVAALPGLIPVIYTLVIAIALDVATALWAAWASGTFSGKFIPEFIQSHVMKKVGPILLVLLAGVSVGGTDSAQGLALLTLAGGSITAYLAAVVASIRANLSEGSSGTKGIPSSVEPPPTD